MNGETAKPRTIDGLQYLRGVAALMVVFFHSRSYFVDVPEWTRIGSRGVDIFFVISGFIMVHATRNIGGDVSALKASAMFLLKRFIRVVPLYWIALLWTAAPYLGYWFSLSHSAADLSAHVTPELLSIFKDFLFIPHPSIDPEEQGEMFPILIQGWTLNYEVVFYLVFGVALLQPRHRVLSVTLLLAGAVVLGRIHHFGTAAGQFYTSPIVLEFVFGMLVYEIHVKTRQLSFNRLTMLGLGIVGLLLLGIGSSGNDKIVLGTSAAIIVWIFIKVFDDMEFFPLKVLGDASYSIYLFHLAAFKLARMVMNGLGLHADGYGTSLLMIFINVSISVAVGITLYYLVEKPVLRFLRSGVAAIASSRLLAQGPVAPLRMVRWLASR